MVGEAWVKLAVFTIPHGVKGALKVKSFTEPARAFAEYTLTDELGNPITLAIIGGTDHAPIVQIEGVNDRNEAERWRNKAIGTARSAIDATNTSDALLVRDLLGMTVIDTQGTPLGIVDRVMNFGASDILDIIFNDGSAEMFTFTESNFPAIDRAARRITFVPPFILGSKEEESDDA